MTKLQLYRLSYIILIVVVVVWSRYISSSTSVFEFIAWCFFMILAINCLLADMLTKDKDGC